MQRWRETFNDDAERIEKLRGVDPVFEEICQDYEDMLCELTRNGNQVSADRDMVETVAALELEIWRYLGGEKATFGNGGGSTAAGET